MERGEQRTCKNGFKRATGGGSESGFVARSRSRKRREGDAGGTHKGRAVPPSRHEPRATGEARAKLRWGPWMTPGHSCTRTPALFRRSCCQQEAGHRHVGPWRQSAFGLMQWISPPPSGPILPCPAHNSPSDRSSLAWANAPAPIKFQGHPSIAGPECQVAESAACYRQPASVKITTAFPLSS